MQLNHHSYGLSSSSLLNSRFGFARTKFSVTFSCWLIACYVPAVLPSKLPGARRFHSKLRGNFLLFQSKLCENLASSVRKCRDENGRELVAKIYRRTPSTTATYTKELRALQTFKHKNISKLVDHFTTDDQLVLILQDCGEEAFNIISNGQMWTENELRDMIHGIFDAVKLIHDKNAIHGDIKLENICIDRDGQAYLIDFGLVEFLNINETSSAPCGSSFYRSPELEMGKPHNAKIDVWALGLTLYTMAMGEFPFCTDDEYANSIEVISSQPDFTAFRERYSDDFADLVEMMLTKDSIQRPTIAKCLEHPWFHSRL